MKVVKDIEQSLLLNYFGLEDKFYLVVTVMTFFGFDNPDEALSEQELWPFVQGELGKDSIFDMAMPKPRGEVLVHGSCFAPEGTSRPASEVSLRIGGLGKILNVFGNRFWKRVGGTMQVISDPEPFTKMAISYAGAFGGSGYEKNPLGKGFAPVIDPTGKEVHPLPNIEDPKKIVGAPSDKPDPAGFGPYDYAWPQRALKLGTYDNKWFRERWPFYPEDMDWTYFNAAPEDQQMSEFFKGGEAFRVTNMHPKKPLIESRLPALRQRCFINQLSDMKKPEGETIFREVITHLDTAWLFPHAERGVAVYRGTVQVADDEALDVLQLMLATEPLSGEQKTIEHYFEEFKKRIDRTVVPAAMTAAMAEAKEKLAGMKETLQDLPLQIKDSVAQGLGQAPKPVRTPKEIIGQSMGRIDAAAAQLDDAKSRFLEMKEKFGHLAKIDISRFDQGKAKLAATKEQLQALNLKIDAFQGKMGSARQKAKDAIKAMLDKAPPDIAASHEIPDLERVLAEPERNPADLWHESGMRFIEKCRDNLRENGEAFGKLRTLGFRPYTVTRHWLGLNPTEETHDPALWGLEKKGDAGHLLPAGLIIPRFDGAKLDKIIVRPGDMTDPSGDVLVNGSGDGALALGVGEGKAFVRVADELEAMFLHQELGGICTVIAMKDPKAKPDKATAAMLKKAPQFLVVLYPHSAEAADKDPEMWKTVHPEAESLGFPPKENLFTAKKAGTDLWQWVADALRPGVAPDPADKPKDPDINEPGALASLIPALDVPGMMKEIKETIMARVQPKLDMVEAKKKEAMAAVKKSLTEKGYNADELLKPNTAPSILREANPYATAKARYAEIFATTRQKLTDQKMMTPEIATKLADAEKSNQQILTNAAAQYEQGMAKLAAAKDQIKGGLPDWAKKLLGGASIDPEDPEPLRNWTREEVVARYEAGGSLAGKNLNNVDLSGLTLPGIDFRQAQLQKANLTGCNLDKADLTGALANEADFSGASLKEVKMARGLFQKAKFVDAKMQSSDLTGVVASEADFTGADLSHALMVQALLEKAKLTKAKLTEAGAGQAYFLSADLTGADMTGADVNKAVFLKAKVDEARFSHGKVRGTIFIESKGTKVDFSGADMHNSRILQGSAITESDFTHVTAEKSCWMTSDLSGGDFRRSDIKSGLVQECNLSGANLEGVTAVQSRFTKSDLTDANLKGVNMMFGSLRKSKLVRTDLTRARLYGVEFYRTGVGDTKFDEANLKMTKLDKRVELIPDPKPDKDGGKGSTGRKK